MILGKESLHSGLLSTMARLQSVVLHQISSDTSKRAPAKAGSEKIDKQKFAIATLHLNIIYGEISVKPPAATSNVDVAENPASKCIQSVTTS